MLRSEAHEARNQFLRENFADNDVARKGSMPTSETVTKVTGDLKAPLETVDIPDSDGARLHLIGDKSAERVILYFHGGGFGLPAFEGHVKFLYQSQQKLANQGSTVLIALLEYGYTRTKKYPTQLNQATDALRWLLEQGYRASNIIVGGDSAGGNMTLGLASHIAHPCERIKTLSLQEKLAGLLLISPWVSFESDSESYERNKDTDIFKAESMHNWAKDYVLEEERNNWTEPLRAEVKWWETLPTKRVLLVYGSVEVLQDVDKAIGEKLKAAGADIRSVECADQVHIDCIMDAQTDLQVGPMSTEIWQWLGEVL